MHREKRLIDSCVYVFYKRRVERIISSKFLPLLYTGTFSNLPVVARIERQRHPGAEVLFCTAFVFDEIFLIRLILLFTLKPILQALSSDRNDHN